MSSPIAEHAYNPPSRGLDTDRRLHDLTRWRRHSLLIKNLRRVLPAVIAALLIALVGWAAYNTIAYRLYGGAQASGLAIRMVNPKFYGRDAAGKPFFLAAASAVRDDKQEELIYLDQPVMINGATPLTQTRVTALKGQYREDTRILVLDGDVHMHNGEGDDFVSPHALVDTLTSDVDGQAHIDGHGPLGAISASSYAVRAGGAHVFFTGRVSAHIEQHAVSSETGQKAAR